VDEKNDELEEQLAELEKIIGGTVVPDEEFLMQLTLMGFPLELSKQGLIKVKNESVAAAVDAIMELKETDPSTTASKH